MLNSYVAGAGPRSATNGFCIEQRAVHGKSAAGARCFRVALSIFD